MFFSLFGGTLLLVAMLTWAGGSITEMRAIDSAGLMPLLLVVAVVMYILAIWIGLRYRRRTAFALGWFAYLVAGWLVVAYEWFKSASD